jgi:HSP20 family protein
MLWTDPFAPITGKHAPLATFLPAADVAISGDDLVVTMDVPGLTAEDLSIEVKDTSLLVRGERKRPLVAEGTSYTHVERPFGAFERHVRVPRGTDPDRITASLDNGVLSLIVPKPERLKPKAIRIGTATEQRQLETTAA